MLLGPTTTNSSSFPIECHTTVNSSVLQSSSELSMSRIPGKSLDEGLVPLMSNQDVLSLLQYVPIYKEIKVYVKKSTMEVVLGTGKGVVIEEVVEDDEVKEAS
ncbi:hypothetical protein Tco_0834417 [Tanacetum coccineum]